jgi:FixJ family two-component response regulator
MTASRPIVFVVDDDVSVRESLEALIQRHGWQAETFATAREFLLRARASEPSCLILDVSLPDLNGLDLQNRISIDRIDMPIIFITGFGDVSMTVRAMEAGAVEFLTKPFDDETLLNAVRGALARSRAALDSEQGMRAIRERYALLSRREREVMILVVSDRPVEQAGRRGARNQ